MDVSTLSTAAESITLVAALSTAVWFLNRRNDRLNEKLDRQWQDTVEGIEKRLDDCETDRKELREAIEGMLRGCANPVDCAAKKKLTERLPEIHALAFS